MNRWRQTRTVDRPRMDGALAGAAMRELARRHLAHLRALGPVRVLALDPCPRCMGRVIAGDMEARCASGCGWSYRAGNDAEPVASRKATRPDEVSP